MSKTKKQLRAEAVERLKEINEHSCNSDEIIMALVPADIVVAESNWTAEIRFIIDLVADEEPPEGDVVAIMRDSNGRYSATDYVRLTVGARDTSDMFVKLADMIERDYVRRETDVSDSREKLSRTENAESVPQADLSDSREKLEEDILAYRGKPSEDDRIAELEAKNAKLEAELDDAEYDCRTCDAKIELKERVSRLEIENINLRNKLSIALDHAHAIGKLGEL